MKNILGARPVRPKGVFKGASLWIFVAICASSTTAHAVECAWKRQLPDLERRFQKDQAARGALQVDPANKALLKKALAVDAENTRWSKALTSQCGWPKQSEIGADAAEKFWVLTQHADNDPRYQKFAATLLKAAVLQHEARPWNLASLVDRNRMLQQEPQLYGLQFRRDEATGLINFIPIEAPQSLDDRRKEIGLQPFACWIQKIAKRDPDAGLVWPSGVPYKYSNCEAE